MPTIYDIAKRAGVSSTTVSRALNNHSDVKESTKRMLQELAKEMGYHPNSQAKSLAMKKSWSIGILLNDESSDGLKHVLFANMIESMSKVAADRGYDITFLSGKLGEQKLSYIEHSTYRMFDGIIIANADIYDENITKLIKGTKHIAFIDQVIPKTICVNSQNRNGMRLSVKHLYKKGYRKITYVHGQSNNYVSEKRILGFQEVCEELGILDDCNLVEGKYTHPFKAYEITKQLIKEGLPDAIIYSDDYSASGGLKCLIEHGIKVPEDVAIMGYDGIDLANLLTPKLTTVYQNVDLIGETVTNNLINSIENNRPIEAIIELPVVLVEGETT